KMPECCGMNMSITIEYGREIFYCKKCGREKVIDTKRAKRSDYFISSETGARIYQCPICEGTD
ncbi:MAG: hypothetical protein ACFFDN_46135, partial [Candidatus Hodarchaeota archaeon]